MSALDWLEPRVEDDDPDAHLVVNGWFFGMMNPLEFSPLAHAVVADGGWPDGIEGTPEKFNSEADFLAYVLECLDAYRRWLRGLVEGATERLRSNKDFVQTSLEARLGMGEIADPQTGRVAYLGRVSAGKAEVNVSAIEEHHAVLVRLGCGMQRTPPTLTKLRQNEKHIRAAGLALRQLVNMPAKTEGLRWKKLKETDDDQ